MAGISRVRDSTPDTALAALLNKPSVLSVVRPLAASNATSAISRREYRPRPVEWTDDPLRLAIVTPPENEEWPIRCGCLRMMRPRSTSRLHMGSKKARVLKTVYGESLRVSIMRSLVAGSELE
jgi:hypothetical protein